jgi:outer membrane protein TolC
MLLLAAVLLAGGCMPGRKPAAPSIETYLPSSTPLPRGQEDGGPGQPPHDTTERQRRPAVEPLSLEACTRIALDTNPLAQAAREGVEAARHVVGEARAAYYPEVAARAGYQRFERHIFLPEGLTARQNVPPTVGPTNDWSANLRVRYTLVDFGERRARLQAALAQQEVAEEEAAAIRQDIALNVHQAYYGLGAARENLDVARRNLTRAETHLTLAQKRKASGAVPKADVVRARVEVADARLALVRAEALVQTLRGNLNTAMGLPVEIALKVRMPRDADAGEARSLTAALDAAVRARPELRAALQRVAADRSGVEAAESAFGPRVVTEASWGRRDDAFWPDDPEWSAAALLEWPLFTGGSRTHRLARSKAELAREQAETRRLVLQVRDEVWSAHWRLKEAREALDASEALVADAQESMRAVRERYEAGADTVNDLLDAQTALARAEAVRVEAELDCHIAHSAFRRAVGTLLESDP